MNPPRDYGDYPPGYHTTPVASCDACRRTCRTDVQTCLVRAHPADQPERPYHVTTLDLCADCAQTAADLRGPELRRALLAAIRDKTEQRAPHRTHA